MYIGTCLHSFDTCACSEDGQASGPTNGQQVQQGAYHQDGGEEEYDEEEMGPYVMQFREEMEREYGPNGTALGKLCVHEGSVCMGVQRPCVGRFIVM
jgi:hypothetical protein